MLYSAPIVLALLGGFPLADAAPSVDKRFNQPPRRPESHAVDLPIRTLSRRIAHPDKAVQLAYIRDEVINHRFRHASRLDAETLQYRKADEAFLERQRSDMEKRDGEGSVPLTNYNYDMGYAATVSVGTPAQQFLVVADSGSSDFLLFDKNCAECSGHPTFDSTKSSTFKDIGVPGYNRYGTGNATGKWVTDRVDMGGSFVNNQPFNLVQAGDLANFMGTEISGIMGLGPPSTSSQGPRGPIMDTPPQFYMTAAQSVWPNPEYGVYLERLNDNSATSELPAVETGGEEPHQSNAGYITFGGVNQTLYTGNINFMAANTSYWWQLPLQSINVNGKVLNTGNEPIVIDTGSTMNYFPASIVRTIFASIPGAIATTGVDGSEDGMYALPCNSKFAVSVQMGGVSYSISAADTIRTQLPASAVSGAGNTRYCLANFAAGDWLLGAAFMKNVYTVFRINPPQIGFAALSDFAKKGENPGYSGGSSNSNGGGGGVGFNPSGASIAALDSRSSAVLVALGVVASLFI